MSSRPEPKTDGTGAAKAEFDAFATDYDAALKQGLAASGEGKEFYAQGRMEWLAAKFRQQNFRPASVLDFGCGTGSSTPYFFSCLNVQSVLGVDVSAESLLVAQAEHGSEQTRFAEIAQWEPNGDIDFAFCNGVFHHIPPPERAAAVQYVYRALRPGGYFAFWENNPWNPGTRYVMSRIPFDRDAITLTPPEAKGLLRAGGFDLAANDFLFVFPKSLGFLRFIEPRISRLPLGGQYLVLCRKREQMTGNREQ